MTDEDDFFTNTGLGWLREAQPRFPISAKNVFVLHEPKDFFKELKDRGENATQRITIASLYIGNGPLEDELIASLKLGMRKSQETKLHVLLDATRGSRGTVNSRTLLLPLLNEFPDRSKIALYHSPQLRGWIRWLLPERWNETIGLSHLKVYIFDDTLIMSGANLSDQYFCNRQDRYIVFQDCPRLANYFDQLVKSVSKFSFQLERDNSLQLHQSWTIHPYLGNKDDFVKKANRKISDLIGEKIEPVPEADTWVYPLIQMYPFGITQDEVTTQKLLTELPSESVLNMASGYFNLTNDYMNVILHSCKSSLDILTAAPKANGFYGANGFSGFIPRAYTYIERCFHQDVHRYGQAHRINMYEYERNGWTFHAKGIWYYPFSKGGPVLTLIGSPNFGYRSVFRDLEAQVAVVTSNAELQEKLHKEWLRLYQSCTRVDAKTFARPERKISLWIKIVTSLIKTFF